MRHYLPVLTLALALTLSSGCTTTRFLRNSSSALDSLRSENATLHARLRQLRDSTQFRDDLDSGQYYRDLRVLKDRLNRLTYEVRTLRDGGRTIAVVPADSLFDVGTARLTSAGTERLGSVIVHLQTAYPGRTIRVEGHADSTPLGDALEDRFASNWELSTARAATVVRHLIANSELAAAQFVAVGYGSTDPVASNETATGRRRNRRVRIAVLPPPRDYSRPFETAW